MSDGLRSSCTLPGLERDLRAFAIGRRDRGTAGQGHAERLGQRIHGRGGAHGVAMADRGRGRRNDGEEFPVVDLAGGEILACLPDHCAGTGPLALPPAIQHRTAGQDDGRDVDGGGCHQPGRRGLVTARGQDHAIERVAVQHFDEAQIGEIAVECRSRTLAGFLDRMAREFEGNAAGIANAFAHTLCQFKVMPVARRQIAAGLRDSDDRLARGQFVKREPVIQIALQVERGHAGIVRIVEPELRAQPAFRRVRHRLFRAAQ
jgi:hypothetical protein